MQPKNQITGANLCMDCLTLGCVVNAAGRETEGVHEKVVGRGNVLAYENRDESFDFGHMRLFQCV